MKLFVLPKKNWFFILTSAVVMALGLSACGNTEQTPVFNDNDKRAEFSNLYSENIYNALVAEMYNYYGELGLSADYYSRIIDSQKSLEVAKRLTRLSVEHNNGGSALSAVDSWVEQDPSSLEARQFRALLHIRNDNYKQAATDLYWLQQAIDERSAQLKGKDAESMSGAGVRYVATVLGLDVEKEKSFKAFKEYIKLTDKEAEASLALAAFALNAEKYEEVVSITQEIMSSGDPKDKESATLLYVKALVSQDKNQAALEVLSPLFATSESRNLKIEYARLLIMNDQPEKALKAYKQLSSEYPQDNDVLYTLGLLHLEQKQYSEAIPVLKTLSDLSSKHGETFYFLGEAYEGLNDFESALGAYNQAVSLGFYKEAQQRIVLLMLKEQGYEATLAYVRSKREELKTREDRVESYLIEGSLHYGEKQYQLALDIYKKAETIAPNNTEIWYAESLAYTALEDIDNAEESLRNILQKEPENASALNALGYTLVLHTDRLKEAKAYIEKALEFKPDDPAITDSLGWVEYHLGNLKEAEALLRKAYNKLPDPEVAAHLVEVLIKRGKRSEAVGMLNDMLNKHPQDERLHGVKEKMDLGRL